MAKTGRAAPEGYESGPDAPLRATAHALAKADDARAVVLVEGVSDQIAVETAAAALGRDLAADGIVVVPIGGAHAIGRFLPRFAGIPMAGLCDAREEGVIRRALAVPDGVSLEAVGFFVCVDDLEDELIRAVGVDEVEALFAAEGDLNAFRSMRAQPAWRGREPVAQMRRFIAGGARRKLRYAQVLVEAAVAAGGPGATVRTGALPRPLVSVLAAF